MIWDQIIYQVAHLREKTYAPSVRSHYLPVVLHPGLGLVKFSSCMLAGRLALPLCISCLGSHIVEILTVQLPYHI